MPEIKFVCSWRKDVLSFFWLKFVCLFKRTVVFRYSLNRSRMKSHVVVVVKLLKQIWRCWENIWFNLSFFSLSFSPPDLVVRWNNGEIDEENCQVQKTVFLGSKKFIEWLYIEDSSKKKRWTVKWDRWNTTYWQNFSFFSSNANRQTKRDAKWKRRCRSTTLKKKKKWKMIETHANWIRTWITN